MIYIFTVLRTENETKYYNNIYYFFLLILGSCYSSYGIMNWISWEIQKAMFLAWLRKYIKVVIIFAIIFSIIGGLVANHKNHSVIGWVLLCFFFGLLPLLILLVIPEKNNSIQKANDTKKCPFCAEEIKQEAIICRFCGKEINNSEIVITDDEKEDKKDIKNVDNWICGRCGSVNNISILNRYIPYCKGCGKEFTYSINDENKL